MNEGAMAKYRESLKVKYQVTDDELDACIRIVVDYTGPGYVSLAESLSGVRLNRYRPLLDRLGVDLTLADLPGPTP